MTNKFLCSRWGSNQRPPAFAASVFPLEEPQGRERTTPRLILKYIESNLDFKNFTLLEWNMKARRARHRFHRRARPSASTAWRLLAAPAKHILYKFISIAVTYVCKTKLKSYITQDP